MFNNVSKLERSEVLNAICVQHFNMLHLRYQVDKSLLSDDDLVVANRVLQSWQYVLNTISCALNSEEY